MPECGYCKDCRHWEGFSSREYGDCKGHKVYDYAENYVGQAKNARQIAFIVGGLDWSHAGLITQPDFGCLKFEPKKT